MSLNSLQARRDAAMLLRHGEQLRWTRSNGATTPLQGIIDLAVDFLGDDSAVPYQGKTVTVLASEMEKHTHGDKLQNLETGQRYELQRTLKHDGLLKTVEITTC